LHYLFADLAVLCLANASDKKFIFGFLWGMYRKRGQVFCGHKRKKQRN